MCAAIANCEQAGAGVADIDQIGLISSPQGVSFNPRKHRALLSSLYICTYPDTSQYGTWNRTRRLQVPPYVATENNVSRTQSRASPPDTLILNMNDVENIINNQQGSSSDPSKKDDTLFGPGVGVISSGPNWAESSNQPSKDEISPEVLKSWLAKSKDASYSVRFCFLST